jgi:chromosome partitioning protein
LKTALLNHLPENLYDYILIDCPPALGSTTINAMHASNMVLIPTQPEYFSSHALKNVITSIRQVRNSGNASLIYRILITLNDKRNRIHRSITDQLRSTFGSGVMQTVIDVDTKLRESTIAGLPITHFIAKTRGSLQYQDLAQELTGYAQETVTPSAASAA